MLATLMLMFQLSTPPQFIISDVVATEWCEDTVTIDAIMPNGDIHIYEVDNDNLPEEIDEVVFMTVNVNDYTTYEVVGFR